MNNFEKRTLLNYFIKLLPRIRFNVEFDEFFADFLDTFNLSEKTFEPYFVEGGFKRYSLQRSKEKKKFEKIITNVLSKKLSKTPKTSCFLEKQLLLIKDIYNFSDKEYEILMFLALNETCDLINEFFDCWSGRYKNRELIESILTIRKPERIKIVDNLHYKGIIEVDNFDIELNDFWNSIFNNSKFNTKEKIVSKILGSPLKSKLTLNDFKHIEDESKDAINILSAAVKEKKKGVNILLYGDVGTGKTEFAKLMANSLNINMYGVITEKERFKEPDREERLVDLSSKQCILEKSSNSCILFDEAEDVMNTGFSFFNKTASKGHLNYILETNAVPVIWTTNNIEDVDPAFLRKPLNMII